MSQKFSIGTQVMLKPGSPSYNHFVGYMSVTGTIVQYSVDHKVGKIVRPYLIRFSDGRESWFDAKEIVKL